MSAAASDTSVATFGDAAAQKDEDNTTEVVEELYEEVVVKTMPRRRSTSAPWQGPAGAIGARPTTAAYGAGGNKGCMYVRILTPPRAPGIRGAGGASGGGVAASC